MAVIVPTEEKKDNHRRYCFVTNVKIRESYENKQLNPRDCVLFGLLFYCGRPDRIFQDFETRRI